jgi:hypothetical protein
MDFPPIILSSDAKVGLSLLISYGYQFAGERAPIMNQMNNERIE